MLKIIGKACISVIMAFLLSLAVWYFLLIKLPDHQVIGIAAPTMSKEEVLSLLNFHGAQVAYVKNGEWFFRRDGKDCKLTKMEK